MKSEKNVTLWQDPELAPSCLYHAFWYLHCFLPFSYLEILVRLIVIHGGQKYSTSYLHTYLLGSLRGLLCSGWSSRATPVANGRIANTCWSSFRENRKLDPPLIRRPLDVLDLSSRLNNYPGPAAFASQMNPDLRIRRLLKGGLPQSTLLAILLVDRAYRIQNDRRNVWHLAANVRHRPPTEPSGNSALTPLFCSAKFWLSYTMDSITAALM